MTDTPPADHIGGTRAALAQARWQLRLARDTGEVPAEVARLLLAALAETDDRLARYEDD